ncbi:IS5 family transposase [Candidatus Regiella insecticola]|uniref:IS5 family transposase n=1 Tax=Candidatus Regiella insecticola TaxID=138073 RepID=UPI00387EA6C7
MNLAHRRHDISDHVWSLLEAHLPGRKGTWGGIARDNRQFINAVFWILRTGAPWRDKGLWESLLEALIVEPDFEWLMIDATHSKVHPHAAGAKGGNQDMERNKRGLNSKIHLAVDAHGMPVRIFITSGTTADCQQAMNLTKGVAAEYLLADKGYDSDNIIKKAEEAGMQIVIPPKKNRKIQREYDKALYKHRHLVENAFLHLKRWRGIATRYAKNTSSFLAAVQIRCLALWLKIS